MVLEIQSIQYAACIYVRNKGKIGSIEVRKFRQKKIDIYMPTSIIPSVWVNTQTAWKLLHTVHNKFSSSSSSIKIFGASGSIAISPPFLHMYSLSSAPYLAASSSSATLQRQLSSSFYLFLHGASIFLYCEFLEVCQHMLEARAISL